MVGATVVVGGSVVVVVVGAAVVVVVVGAVVVVFVVVAAAVVEVTTVVDFSSDSLVPPTTPMVTSPATATPTIHGHFRFLELGVVGSGSGAAGEPGAPKTCVGASPPVGRVCAVHWAPSQYRSMLGS